MTERHDRSKVTGLVTHNIPARAHTIRTIHFICHRHFRTVISLCWHFGEIIGGPATIIKYSFRLFDAPLVFHHHHHHHERRCLEQNTDDDHKLRGEGSSRCLGETSQGGLERERDDRGEYGPVLLQRERVMTDFLLTNDQTFYSQHHHHHHLHCCCSIHSFICSSVHHVTAYCSAAQQQQQHT